MNFLKIYDNILLQNDITFREKILLSLIISWLEENKIFNWHDTAIVKKSGMSKQQLRTALKHLDEKKYITRKRTSARLREIYLTDKTKNLLTIEVIEKINHKVTHRNKKDTGVDFLDDLPK